MAYKDREDQRRYARAHYNANKELYKDRAKQFQIENRKRLREYALAAKDRPCEDCGQHYKPWIMEFDHVRGEKLANVADLVKDSVSLKRLQEEIDKCEVVCANCHRERTWQRKGDDARRAG